MLKRKTICKMEPSRMAAGWMPCAPGSACVCIYIYISQDMPGRVYLRSIYGAKNCQITGAQSRRHGEEGYCKGPAAVQHCATQTSTRPCQA